MGCIVMTLRQQIMSSSAQLQRLADSAGSLLNCAGLVLEHATGEQQQKLLLTIREHMLEYARMHVEVQQSTEVLQQVKDEAVVSITNGTDTDLTQMLDETQRRTAQRMANVSERELTTYPRYQQLLQREEAAGSAAAAAAGDQELVMTETHMVTRDPWSQQEIRQPYRNARCGHLYDRSSLEAVLQKRSRRPTCPHVGCTNKMPLRWEDLTEDTFAKQAIEKKKTQA
ncbi:E3 SUMO-protein ligase NSE2-like isoform X4 [Amphibalanus amphitrite]|uniref:E3 SUMO-protein ligase NSE2-like isoform X4 n=1 Tax=Amphibalanus amphitrite TaxID=1232801 RepID=UPI001C911C0B|nr:E3 SUMO-protein ligase NSE2-like isoform X4 [Amphibalanus amphitrite]